MSEKLSKYDYKDFLGLLGAAPLISTLDASRPEIEAIVDSLKESPDDWKAKEGRDKAGFGCTWLIHKDKKVKVYNGFMYTCVYVGKKHVSLNDTESGDVFFAVLDVEKRAESKALAACGFGKK